MNMTVKKILESRNPQKSTDEVALATRQEETQQALLTRKEEMRLRGILKKGELSQKHQAALALIQNGQMKIAAQLARNPNSYQLRELADKYSQFESQIQAQLHKVHSAHDEHMADHHEEEIQHPHEGEGMSVDEQGHLHIQEHGHDIHGLLLELLEQHDRYTANSQRGDQGYNQIGTERQAFSETPITQMGSYSVPGLTEAKGPVLEALRMGSRQRHLN